LKKREIQERKRPARAASQQKEKVSGERTHFFCFFLVPARAAFRTKKAKNIITPPEVCGAVDATIQKTGKKKKRKIE
jgi:hypothetical protein